MPDLVESLQGYDLGHLRIIASLWSIELDAPDSHTALARLAEILIDPPLVETVVKELPPEARTALADLARSSGRMPWAQFCRRYGELRQMGAVKRDRLRPYLKPASPVEVLWYRALVGRTFFDTPTGPEEFAYIPDELLALLPPAAVELPAPLGRAALPTEHAHLLLASDRILDHATTLLAALRLGKEIMSDWGREQGMAYPLTVVPLKALLSAAALLDSDGMPQPEQTRAFLEANRPVALAQLVRAWLDSLTFNELHMLPGLRAEGEWQNDPRLARRAVLDFLAGIPPNTWWSLPAFIGAIHQRHPDFQRPAGDYDSWFIRDVQTDQYLRGFEHWDAVDGVLLRYIISGPLYWLGMMDLAAPAPEGLTTAFRFSAWAGALFHGEPPQGMEEEKDRLHVRSDARLGIPRLAPRLVRYQVARFCEWEKETPDAYQYRITAASLQRARQQGLTVRHLLSLLRQHTASLPPGLPKALERWEQYGSEARLERLVVLRVASAEVLQALRKSRAARFLGEPLGATAVAVKPGAADKVLSVLAELGYIGESRVEGEEPGA